VYPCNFCCQRSILGLSLFFDFVNHEVRDLTISVFGRWWAIKELYNADLVGIFGFSLS
jgi:hypothetical protein